MPKLRLIKAQLKAQRVWKQYYAHFGQRCALRLSKMTLALDSQVSVIALATLEVKLLAAKTGQDYASVFGELEKVLNITGNWRELGEFMMYAYATAKYKRDRKREKPNLYLQGEAIKLNNQKRAHFHAWMSSLDESRSDYNIIIQKVMRYGF